jgi:putative hydrolase of the HAD superfamily
MTAPRIVVFDLDDTLFPERAYVLSGLRAVAAHVRARLGCSGFAEAAWTLYRAGVRGRIFDEALARLGLPVDPSLVAELVAIYRDHRPAIALFPEVGRVVRALSRRALTAIVSDGPLRAQERKVEALGLCAQFAPILLTDRWGRAFWKPHERAFRAIEAACGCGGAACVYVGDNPLKDFVAPRRLGWRTVRVRRAGGEHAGLEAPAAADVECTTLEALPQLLGVEP